MNKRCSNHDNQYQQKCNYMNMPSILIYSDS